MHEESQSDSPQSSGSGSPEEHSNSAKLNHLAPEPEAKNNEERLIISDHSPIPAAHISSGPRVSTSIQAKPRLFTPTLINFNDFK